MTTDERRILGERGFAIAYEDGEYVDFDYYPPLPGRDRRVVITHYVEHDQWGATVTDCDDDGDIYHETHDEYDTLQEAVTAAEQVPFALPEWRRAQLVSEARL